MDMPIKVLRSRAAEIERYLTKRGLQRPTLWDLHLARKARKGEK